VVRARRVQGKGDDTVVKLRPVVPGELPSDLRDLPMFNVEVDAMPGGFVCSASMKGALATPKTRETVNGERPLRKLFSKEQRAFFEAHAPAGIALDDLSILGPIFVLKLKWGPADFARPMVAEAWLFPDATMTLELSTKSLPSQAFQAAAEARAFLASKGISATSGQETKTKRALRVFSKRLVAEQQAAAEA
jgi:hypothetical protein